MLAADLCSSAPELQRCRQGMQDVKPVLTMLHADSLIGLCWWSSCNSALTLPVQVSEECKDLLRKVLMADPGQRLTIQGIMQHPWFLQDLPVGALEVNSRLKMMDNVRCAKATAWRLRSSACHAPQECMYASANWRRGSPVCHQAWRLFEPSLALLSCAANPCRGISEYHWRVSDCRFGQCKQTAQEILDLVNECNEVEAEAPREVDASRVGSLDLETYAP